MVEDSFHPSVGILRYSTLEDGSSKLIVEVDPDVSYFARALALPAINMNRQRFAPHVTVIRNERACDHPLWGAHEGKPINFEYGSYAYDNGLFYWLRIRGQALVDIRLALGLPIHSKYSKPPDGTRWFHMTIGNTRDLV